MQIQNKVGLIDFLTLFNIYSPNKC